MRRAIVMGLLFACCSIAAEPVGLLTRVSGKVQVIRAGQKDAVEAHAYDLLFAGDRIITSSGAEAGYMFCPATESARVAAGSEVSFAGNQVEVLKGSVSGRAKTGPCRLPKNLALGNASTQTAGVTRLRGMELALLAPCSTNVAINRPSFQWSPVREADAYQLSITDREERTIWKASTSALQVTYAPDAPPLDWGQKYWWGVQAQKGGEVLEEARAQFTVLPREQADMVQQAAKQIQAGGQDKRLSMLLLALLYDANGVLDQALEAYRGSEDLPWVRTRISEITSRK